MKYFAISAVLIVSTLTAHVARADDDKFDPYGYLTIGASRSAGLFDGTVGDAFSPLSGQVSGSWGANAHAGYRFNKYLAGEVEYEWNRDFGLRAGGVDIGKIQTQVATANLKVIAPFGAFQPYFLVGAGALFTTTDKSFNLQWDVANGVFTMKFGAGLDYWVTKNLSLSLGAEVAVNNAKITGPGFAGGHGGEGIDYLAGQFGFGYRF
jgi:opacity protein-like surface antigen